MNDHTRQPDDYRNTAIVVFLAQDGPGEAWLIDEADALIDEGGDEASICRELMARGVQTVDAAERLVMRAKTRRTFGEAAEDFSAGKFDTPAMLEIRQRAAAIVAQDHSVTVTDGRLVETLVRLGASQALAQHIAGSQDVRANVSSNVNLQIGTGAAAMVVGLIALVIFDIPPTLAGLVFVIGLLLTSSGLDRRKEAGRP